MKILLVEDEHSLRATVGRVLVTAGYEVLAAENGCAALGLMKSDHFDGLITDLLMPGRDGLEVISEFRRCFPGGSVLATSGGGDFIEGELCLDLAKRLGADAVLEKPFSQNDLLQAVERMKAK